jgi:ubiquitin-protein ligase
LCERYRCIKSASEFRNLPPKAAFCPQIYHFFMNQANALCAEEVSD